MKPEGRRLICLRDDGGGASFFSSSKGSLMFADGCWGWNELAFLIGENAISCLLDCRGGGSCEFVDSSFFKSGRLNLLVGLEPTEDVNAEVA